MIVYKVVKVVNGELVSCITTDDQLKTVYKQSGWTYPKFKGSRLFVFDTLDNARRFCDLNEQVWECKIDKSFKCIYSLYKLKYWKAKIARKAYANLASECTIGGALMADRVKMIRRVW